MEETCENKNLTLRDYKKLEHYFYTLPDNMPGTFWKRTRLYPDWYAKNVFEFSTWQKTKCWENVRIVWQAYEYDGDILLNDFYYYYVLETIDKEFFLVPSGEENELFSKEENSKVKKETNKRADRVNEAFRNNKDLF